MIKNKKFNWTSKKFKNYYKNISRRLSSNIEQAKAAYEKNTVEKSKKDPKILFKYINKKQNVKDYIRSMTKPDNSITNDLNEIANILNKQFQSAFTHESEENMPDICSLVSPQTFISNIQLDFSDVESKLKNLEEQKSICFDLVSPAVLTNCANSLTLPLTIVFNESMREGTVVFSAELK